MKKLLRSLDSNILLLDAFKVSNNILLNAVKSIAELVSKPGLINVDFSDIKTVMFNMGVAVIGSGCASGNDRAKLLTMLALNSDFFDDIKFFNAKGILVNISSGIDVSISEFEDICFLVRECIFNVSVVIIGNVMDTSYDSELKVTLIVTGFELDLSYNNYFNIEKKIDILE